MGLAEQREQRAAPVRSEHLEPQAPTVQRALPGVLVRVPSVAQADPAPQAGPAAPEEPGESVGPAERGDGEARAAPVERVVEGPPDPRVKKVSRAKKGGPERKASAVGQVRRVLKVHPAREAPKNYPGPSRPDRAALRDRHSSA